MKTTQWPEERELLVRLHPFLMAQIELNRRGIPFLYNDRGVRTFDRKTSRDLRRCISDIDAYLRRRMIVPPALDKREVLRRHEAELRGRAK
jgi:hypothetical protein